MKSPPCPTCGKPWAPEHGLQGYVRDKCRCEICSSANRAAAKLFRKKKLKNITEHNFKSYNCGCRCDICREANTVYQRAVRRMHADGDK